MFRKRLKNKITEASKSLSDTKIVGDKNLGRKAQNTLEVAKTTTMASGDGLRRKVPGALKTTGANLLSKRERISSETAAVVHALDGVVSNVSYADLSSALQTKFKMAGLGSERGARTAAEAQSFYESSVPDSVRIRGEDAVREWLAGKDASHIESFENAPDIVKSDSNILWEKASANRARGAEDMTGLEQIQINLSGGFESFVSTAAEIVPQAMFYAAAIEGGISIVENSIYVYRGHKDVSTALQDIATNTAKSAVIGLVAGTAIAGASALGAAPVIAAAAPVLGVVGGALLVYSASKRIHTALTVPVYDEQGKVIDSYVVRYIDEDDLSDAGLLVPLNNQLVMLNELKAEILRVVPKSDLTQLPVSNPAQSIDAKDPIMQMGRNSIYDSEIADASVNLDKYIYTGNSPSPQPSPIKGEGEQA